MSIEMNPKKCVIIVLAFFIGTGPNAKADFTFSQRVNLGPVVNSPQGDFTPFIAPDGLSLYFSSERPGGLGQGDIWVTTRATVSDAWEPPANLGAPVNSGYHEASPAITADGLTFAFSSNAPGGLGEWDIWLTTRPTKESPWGPPVNLGSPVNSAGPESPGCISPDVCSLYFSNALYPGPGAPPTFWSGGDIYVTTRPTTDNPWGPPVNLGLMPSRGGSGNWDPSISADGLALFFDSDYANVALFPDIWLATRTSNDSSWGTPILLGTEINTSGGESHPSISADGSTLYWCSGPFDSDLWQSTISPIVDFNGDGIVNAADACIMIDRWGEDYSACDIGPMPWGDGIVDVKDLIVLTEHLFEKVDDPTLIAHWPLDEVQGVIAYDSAAVGDGTLMGGPVWQPDSGMVAGALQFDGIDDYVRTNHLLNPSDGKFSVLAWIKGGAPGQVVLSQANGVNWLCLDSVEGCMMTELKATGRGGGPLPPSQAVITDGNWHRVGLVWDGSYRHLYVDGEEVANDATPLLGLASAEGGLYFGAGSTLVPGSFFSGLIDDVRIYDRAVRP